MSLINDALKRASESDRNRQRQARSHTPMEPAPPHSSGGSLSLVLGACILLALALAGWFFWQWWSARHSVAPVKMETAATAHPVLRQAAPAPPVAAPAPAPVVVVPKFVPAPAPAPETAPPPPAKPIPTPAPGPPPWPIELKLMGIFFNKTNPQALINARTVSVGSEIEGIRVTEIERDHVTVEWGGQVKQLTLE